MAIDITQSSNCTAADDDYIDMEVSSSSNFLSYSISSPPQSREFEFQMSSISLDKETRTSPADELFYKGKLLPLHLPPRLQMVKNLLQNNKTATEDTFEESYAVCSTTPSSNISLSESCRVSSELNPEDCFFEWSTEIKSFIGDQLPKQSWTKKLKKSSLCQKLKASSSYLKSIFSKSGGGCTDESCAKATGNVDTKAKDCGNKYVKVEMKRNPLCRIENEKWKMSNTLKKSIEKEMAEDYCFNGPRRSFSGVIHWHSANRSLSSTSSSGSSSSSSSFSFSSNGYCDLQLLKRSSSASSEIENSIEGAIAHCKKSQQLFSPRKSDAAVSAS